MPWLAAAATVAAPIIGGVLGQNAASGSTKLSEDYAKKALNALNGVNAPNIDEMKLALQNYALTGEYNPLVEQAINLSGTAMEDVNIDPRLKANQMDALNEISQKAKSGLTQEDLAAFELAQRNSQSESQAKQNQILQEMAQRGQGGQGAELTARLKANQDSTNNLMNAGLQQAVAQEQARMAALSEMANQSSNIRNQDYNEQADLAKAKDLIAQYNAQNSQSVNQRNVASQNNAQLTNLQAKQALSNANTDLANEQQKYNKSLLQQDFNNRMGIATGQANAAGNASQYYGNQAANTAAGYTQAAQGVGKGINSMFGTAAK